MFWLVDTYKKQKVKLKTQMYGWNFLKIQNNEIPKISFGQNISCIISINFNANIIIYQMQIQTANQTSYLILQNKGV